MTDLLWQNQTTGQITWWKMNGAVWTGTYGSIVDPNVLPTSLKVVGTPDLNSDGRQDILMQDQTTGAIYFFLLRNGNIIVSSILTGGLPTEIKVTGIH